MATMIVKIESGGNVKNIATAMRLLKGVAEVKVQKESGFERIPGLPYTREERLESIRQAEDNIRAGRVVTMEHLRAKHPRI